MTVYASDRLLNRCQQNQNQSDPTAAFITMVLELLSAGGLVADSSNPAQACIDYITANCESSIAVTLFAQNLSSLADQYAKGQ